jgi:hypothetical protein
MQVAAPEPRKSSMFSHCGGLTAESHRAKSHFSVKCPPGCLPLVSLTSGSWPNGHETPAHKALEDDGPFLDGSRRQPPFHAQGSRPHGREASTGNKDRRPSAWGSPRALRGALGLGSWTRMGGNWALRGAGKMLTRPWPISVPVLMAGQPYLASSRRLGLCRSDEAGSH